MQQPRKVILLLPSAREFDRGLRRGIIEYAHAYGPWIFCEEPVPYLKQLTTSQRMRQFRKWNADGIIALQDRLPEIKPLRLPTIAVSATLQIDHAHCQLVSDNDAIGQMGAKTILDLGIRQAAYCGLPNLEFSDIRGLSFARTVIQAGCTVEVYPLPIRNTRTSWQIEEQRLTRWLLDLPKPVGLMACNDDHARMIAEICHVQGIRVPDEIAILGVDNDEQVCKSATPPLSSIELAVERAGYEAAKTLARMMSGNGPGTQYISVDPLGVVCRQSTDILAIEDRTMVQAVRFIREHCNRPIQVRDVAAFVGLSRRALQDRFRQTFGRTPIQEIHRSRIERLQRMLIETSMTVGQIAEANGFEVGAHVARFFMRQTGMTPLAYRKKYLRP
jgi:LacI family transcriptional regulator